MISLGLACVALFASTVAAPSQTSSRSVEPFDVSAKSLPASFTGTNLAPIYEAVSKIDTTKDEFETWDEYGDRIDAILRQIKFSASTNGSSTFATSVAYLPQYNAEQKLFNLSPISWIITDYHVFGNRLFKFSSVFSGRTPSVLRRFADPLKPNEPFYGIAFLKDQWPIDIHFSCDPAAARSLKDDLSVLAVFTLRGSSTSNYSGNVYGFLKEDSALYVSYPLGYRGAANGPTKFSVRPLSVILKELWVYNFSSGEVLQKFSIRE